MIGIVTTLFGIILLSVFTFLVVMFYIIIVKEVTESIKRKDDYKTKKFENTIDYLEK